ncbi:MAG: ABC transporter substrate-binding protein, partial [Myxococcaceae bacterium]|nr:ABC transporter substrate-binding protein [Myxococcaceae bacterium]
MTRARFVAGLFVLAGCNCDKTTAVDAGVFDAGPLVLEEKEPNNGPETALMLKGSTIVNANLSADPKTADEDWYGFESALPKTADVTVTAPPGADIAVEVMDEAKSVLATVNSGGAGAAERVGNLNVSGKAFLRVVALKKGAGGAYTLTAAIKDRVPGFEQEPNDRKVDATPVPIGQAMSGFTGHMEDQDWYRYELPSSEPLPAEPIDSGETVDAGGEVVDAGAP